MCLAAAGRVIALQPDGARIDLAGRIRRAQSWLVPDVSPGDWVEVAAGTILRRLTSAEAADLIALGAGDGVAGPAYTEPEGDPT